MSREQYVTVKQVALLLGKHPITIRRHIKKGTFQEVQIGRNVRIKKLKVEAFIESMLESRSYPQTKKPSEKIFTNHDPLFQLVQLDASQADQIVSQVPQHSKRLESA